MRTGQRKRQQVVMGREEEDKDSIRCEDPGELPIWMCDLEQVNFSKVSVFPSGEMGTRP